MTPLKQAKLYFLCRKKEELWHDARPVLTITDDFEAKNHYAVRRCIYLHLNEPVREIFNDQLSSQLHNAIMEQL